MDTLMPPISAPTQAPASAPALTAWLDDAAAQGAPAEIAERALLSQRILDALPAPAPGAMPAQSLAAPRLSLRALVFGRQPQST